MNLLVWLYWKLIEILNRICRENFGKIHLTSQSITNGSYEVFSNGNNSNAKKNKPHSCFAPDTCYLCSSLC